MEENEKSLCTHFGDCGGCAFQDRAYADELVEKESSVRAMLTDDCRQAMQGIIPAPHVEAYRNKMEFAFGDEGKEGDLALGIRKRKSFYEVVTPKDCRIISDDFKQIVLTVLNFFKVTDETFYHRRKHSGALRHLVLRRGEFTGELLVNLVTASTLQVSLEPLVEQVYHLPLSGMVVGFLHTVNDSVSDTVKNEQVHILKGRDYFFEKINGLTFKISAFSFFQTNSAGAERLYQTVRDFAGSGGVMYDLYCGTGTIAQIVADNAQSVTGVELSEEAVRAAAENTHINGISNCTFIAGDVLEKLDMLSQHAGKPDVIIVDPPRDGLHPKTMPKLLALRPKRIVYVSCKPSSLARDLQIFTQNDYHVDKIMMVDMFPRTPHVESVALLTVE